MIFPEWAFIAIVLASSCIIAGFVGITNNPISRYLMKDLEKK